jgi:hypothetical protein
MPHGLLFVSEPLQWKAEHFALRPVIFRSWQPGESSAVVAVTALVGLTSALVVGLLCLLHV